MVYLVKGQDHLQCPFPRVLVRRSNAVRHRVTREFDSLIVEIKAPKEGIFQVFEKKTWER